MLSCAIRSVQIASRSLAPHRAAAASTTTAIRTMATDKKEGDKEPSMPFGLGKMLGLGGTDNLIATDSDRKLQKGNFPDFVPADLKKEMEDMGIDNIGDLDEMEEANVDGYNDLGLVPPEGTGTFSSPILIPSRRAARQVGYVDPASHAVFWFTIHNDDNTYYIKDLGLFFKMLHIPDEEMAAAAH